jgi:hypothetical protein
MSFWNGHHWEGVDTHPIAATSAKPESRTKRLAAAALEASLITALTFGLIAGTAFAGKGGRSGGGATTGGGSLALVMYTDANGNGLPNWGDQVTFTVSTTATDRPTVRLYCYQSGSLVYTFSAGFWSGYPWTTVYGLSSQSWTGGAADCTASLVYSGNNGRINTVATLNVAVGG